tara:strand:+ start:838 stop:2139 length:1302 start_codon:yes stop_codon:yes gene_type:complete
MPIYTSQLEVSTAHPALRPSLALNFARARQMDHRVDFERTSTAWYVDKNRLWTKAGTNQPRFTHDAKTGESLGLWHEGQATNNIPTHNSKISTYKQNDDGLITGPDGVASSARQMVIASDGGTGGTTIVQANDAWGVASGLTWSIFVKITLDDHIDFQLYDNNNAKYSTRVRVYKNGGTPMLRPSSEAGGSTGNIGTTSFEEYPNGWVRIKWENFSGGANATSYFQMYAHNHTNSDGSNVKYAFWGSQIETTKFATSPILTSGAAATRSNENVVVRVGHFDDIYNHHGSSFYIDATNHSNNTGGQYNVLHVGANNDYGHGIFKENGTYDIFWHIRQAGTSLANIVPTIGNWEQNMRVKIGLSYSKTNQVIYVNGGNVASSSTDSTSLTNIDRLHIGSTANNSGPFYGTIRHVYYWASQLPSPQMQLISNEEFT